MIYLYIVLAIIVMYFLARMITAQLTSIAMRVDTKVLEVGILIITLLAIAEAVLLILIKLHFKV